MPRSRRKPRPARPILEDNVQGVAAPTTEKERAIIEAAMALIGERGVDGATTAAIARRAGVTERTLFRYFPTKKDLVRRVLVPLLSEGIIGQQFAALETLLRSGGTPLRDWYVALTSARLAQAGGDPARVRTVMIELLQNEEFRQVMAGLWEKHIWRPMLEQLDTRLADGEIRRGVDIEVLARAIHYLQVGYVVTRFMFAPDRPWDDKAQIAQMADLLTRGCIAEAR